MSCRFMSYMTPEQWVPPINLDTDVNEHGEHITPNPDTACDGDSMEALPNSRGSPNERALRRIFQSRQFCPELFLGPDEGASCCIPKNPTPTSAACSADRKTPQHSVSSPSRFRQSKSVSFTCNPPTSAFDSEEFDCSPLALNPLRWLSHARRAAEIVKSADYCVTSPRRVRPKGTL